MIRNDLKKVMTFHTLKVLSGDLAGQYIDGLLESNHLKKNLDGAPVITKGPIFTAASESCLGLKKGDVLIYEKENLKFTIDRINRDFQQMTRMEFDEEIENVIINSINI